MDVLLLGTIFAIHTIALISPGPDFFMVMKNSLGRSRLDGISTSAGIALGMGVHVIYCRAGFAVIISQSIMLFTIFKILSGIYLIWLGITAWKSKSHSENVTSGNNSDLKKSFIEGFVTNVLNPKASLFFLSLFTIVLPAGLAFADYAIIAGMLIFDAILWFSLVSFAVTLPKVRAWHAKWSEKVNKFFGAVLVLFGIKLILPEK